MYIFFLGRVRREIFFCFFNMIVLFFLYCFVSVYLFIFVIVECFWVGRLGIKGEGNF